jgi:hypothetical protein
MINKTQCSKSCLCWRLGVPIFLQCWAPGSRFNICLIGGLDSDRYHGYEKDIKIKKNESTDGKLKIIMPSSYVVAQNTWRDRASIKLNPFLICFTQKNTAIIYLDRLIRSVKRYPNASYKGGQLGTQLQSCFQAKPIRATLARASICSSTPKFEGLVQKIISSTQQGLQMDLYF